MVAICLVATLAVSYASQTPVPPRTVVVLRAPVFFIHAANDYSIAPGQALDAELRRLGKPHRLMIYPALGRSTREGHGLIYRSVSTWEADVFDFLDRLLKKRAA